jgi:hypothetical protein
MPSKQLKKIFGRGQHRQDPSRQAQKWREAKRSIEKIFQCHNSAYNKESKEANHQHTRPGLSSTGAPVSDSESIRTTAPVEATDLLTLWMGLLPRTRTQPKPRSLRLQQRTRKRTRAVLTTYLDRKLRKEVKSIQQNSDYNLTSMANRVYGFLHDPSLSFWENRTNVLGPMTPCHCYTRPNNMAYHNLCSDAQPPDGIASLLGMGLKFCIESPRPKQRIDGSIKHFQRTVRPHFHFSNQEAEKTNDDASASLDPDGPSTVTYIPSLYLPSD